MTIFGTTLDSQQLFGLISLLTVLAFWIVVLGRERGYHRWFKKWESDRKGRRDAELAAERGDVPPPPPTSKGGPWG